MRIASLGVVLAILLLLAGDREIPKTDDPAHKGQPAWCQRYPAGGYRANCKCRRSCEEGAAEPQSCKVWCRPASCRCPLHCDS